MSTTGSVANFYVDQDGNEQPIAYDASDLVNKLAPEGYHWEKETRSVPDDAWFTYDDDGNLKTTMVVGHTGKYICVKDK